jgi:hypothetical protein
MSGSIMKQSLGQDKFFFLFLTFERDLTNYRDTLIENVKKFKNLPTLLFNHTEGMEHQCPEAKF